jgi:hypothetical protein
MSDHSDIIEQRPDGSVLVKYVPEGYVLVNTEDGTYIPAGRKAGFKTEL